MKPSEEDPSGPAWPRDLPVRVGVLFLEPGLVRVGMGVDNALVAVLVHGVLVVVLIVSVLYGVYS